jgi:hypothetical protein
VLDETLERIGAELRHQYLLGYAPANQGSTGWRSIRVRVTRQRLTVRARAGYVFEPREHP